MDIIVLLQQAVLNHASDIFVVAGLPVSYRAEQLQLAGYEFSDLTVLRIEQGTRFVPDYEVVALAEFFHVSCEYLLGVKKEK